MLEQQGEDSYEAKDAEKLVGEVFSGRLTTLEALQRLRTRLLDLSSRNRLLNYRHSRVLPVPVRPVGHQTACFAIVVGMLSF